MRRAIDRVVKAVGERDIKPVAAAVSAQYADKEGNDKRNVVSLVRVQFLMHPNLYLFAKTFSVECHKPNEARAVVFAAMASVPAGVPPDLKNLSADVYRFDIALVHEDGTWRVLGADWGRQPCRICFDFSSECSPRASRSRARSIRPHLLLT